MIAVIHVHHLHAKKGEGLGFEDMKTAFNIFMKELAAKTELHQVRILMGDANMSNYA